MPLRIGNRGGKPGTLTPAVYPADENENKAGVVTRYWKTKKPGNNIYVLEMLPGELSSRHLQVDSQRFSSGISDESVRKVHSETAPALLRRMNGVTCTASEVIQMC